MDFLEKLKARGQELLEAHENISTEIEQLLDQRIKIAGAIQENQYMQRLLTDSLSEEKEEESEG